MPVSYPLGTIEEHMTCRRAAVMFDVSHLGTVRVEGAGAFERLQSVLTNDLTKITPGRAQYTHLLDPDDASVVDDIIVWWVAESVFDVMPNASNTDRVVRYLGGIDTTNARAVIAVQGPTARTLVATVSPAAAGVGRFRVDNVDVDGVRCVVAGTGYTGEDGIEIAVPVTEAPRVWQALLAAGVVPAGLGARDTLRLEAALPLHGQGINGFDLSFGFEVLTIGVFSGFGLGVISTASTVRFCTLVQPCNRRSALLTAILSSCVFTVPSTINSHLPVFSESSAR